VDIQQYFPVVLFITLCKVVLTFESAYETLSLTFQMKATEQYFPVVLFITLCKVVLTFESVYETLSLTFQMKATEQYFPVVRLLLPKEILHFFSFCPNGP